jgi:hypothetical protein
MMQIGAKTPRFPHRLLLAAWLGALALIWTETSAVAADRTTLFVPLAYDQMTEGMPQGTLADEAFGDEAGDGWTAYMRIWKAHYQDPSDPSIRRFLGLPLKSSFEATAKRARPALRSVGWRGGTYAQVDTPHFVIYSHADEAPSKQVAADLEQCYWVWTQMFFPLWEASPQITVSLRELSPQRSVKEFLKQQPARITIRRKLRVVLFRDAAEYRDTLRERTPGIERSTGFYNNDERETYLYVADVDDAATRRHEMVHQLFREATRSGLSRNMPGESHGFWLIEGIAGYFESLFLADDYATVGGWDSSRLQFARHRMLLGGDRMPFDQLQADGWKSAQQSKDIARWYAHAIAQTHHLLDGDQLSARRWIYRQLADLYKIRAELPEVEIDANQVDRSIAGFLSIDDAHIAANPAVRPLQRLVLAGCDVSPQGFGLIPPSPDLQLLDLTRLRIGNEAIRRLIPEPSSLQQLTLEGTAIDGRLSDWLRKAKKLRELDLSGTPVDDSAIDAVADAAGLETLWMTQTNVSDQALEKIVKMRALQSVDLQRTRVTDEGIRRLRMSRPRLEINPLKILQ